MPRRTLLTMPKRAAPRSVMPELPLTPIERYFYHDHRESHPAWIRYEFTFRGELDHAALERAWTRMAQRHPLTAAIVKERRWRGPLWRLEATRPELEWLEAEADANEFGDLHDLTARSGLRGVVWTTPTETELTLHLHHAVADGLGLLLIAEDLFALYACECGAPVALPAIEELSRRRDRAALGAVAWWRRLPWVLLGVMWGAVLGRQRVVHMQGKSEGRARRELPARSFSAEETTRLRKAAGAAGATLNELLIRDAQVALGAWLQRYGAARPEEWTRLLAPVYLGGPRNESRCSANALGVALIERRVKSLGRRARLLQRAHEDMEFIRSRGLAGVFRMSMRVRGLVPGAIARYCRRPGARSTLVFSNLGKVFGRGPLVPPSGALTLPGAVLVSFAGWGPCRPGTSVFVVTGTYRGQQGLWVSYDPEALSVAQAEEFASELEQQVKCSLEGQ